MADERRILNSFGNCEIQKTSPDVFTGAAFARGRTTCNKRDSG
jgi:hypothetical protein